MADLRTNGKDVLETQSTAEMGPTALELSVLTTAGWESPQYATLFDTDGETPKELILFDAEFTGTKLVTSTLANRYLPAHGLAESGITHPSGIRVVFGPLWLLLRDIHDRIDALRDDVEPGAWQTPSLATGWGHGSSPWSPVRWRAENGTVRLRGEAVKTSGGSGANMTVFTLPTGFRPLTPFVFVAHTTTRTSEADEPAGSVIAPQLIVRTNGQVRLSVNSGIRVSLDGITFPIT